MEKNFEQNNSQSQLFHIASNWNKQVEKSTNFEENQ